MAAIQDLLKQVADTALRARLEEEIGRLAKHKKFGLVFEEHLPECTPLYDLKVRRGSLVAKKDGKLDDLYRVVKVSGETATIGRVVPNAPEEELESVPTSELVVVARFGDPIYPILKPVDSIEHGGGDLWHTLIQADNYHALQLLEYLYPGQVDCIYIDPPYNTGAKDWKYNNDYVDSADSWRHSKWLSMMEKRLALAKKLLNPKDSVLIVTIDEKEYLHLGMLLEQMFPEARMQMVSTVINHAGNGRKGDFCRTNEYIFFLMFGASEVQPHEEKVATSNEAVWDTLRRHNPASIRPNRPKQFYPIYIGKETHKIVKIGDPITPDVDRFSVPTIDGCETVFPVRDDGTEMMWGVIPKECRRRLAGGYVRVGKYSPKKPQQFALQMLSSGTIRDVEKGLLEIIGHREDGSVIAVHPGGKKVLPKNQWDKEEYDARYFGSEFIRGIIGDRFTYPKSVYAVKDSIRYFVSNKPNALILDFFAGSGTTLHAVNLLNAEDGGTRRCILVTNNEVSGEEAAAFRKKGLKPGDAEWEQKGIAQYVTWPRTTCSIRGVDVKGAPLKGEYLGSGAPGGRALPMAGGFKSNAAFFKLGFVDPAAVSIGRAFKEILPLLWMKAGAHGACPRRVEDNAPYHVLKDNRFAVLMDETFFNSFKREIAKHPEIETIYLVTDFEPSYKAMAACFPRRKTCQLYTDYLENFRVNRERK